MSRDLRRYARQTNVRLAIGTIFLLLTVGLGMIYSFYGLGGLVSGLLCILGGLSPIALIALVLWGIDWLVRWANRD